MNERAVAIMEKAVGSEHPYCARGLFAHALFLRETDRDDEAEKLVRRARAIFIRNGLEPPER